MVLDVIDRSLGNTQSRRSVAIASIAVLSALLAAFAPGAPTGLTVWDGILKAGLAAAVTVAGSKAPRWSAIVFAAGAAATVGLGPWVFVAWIALIIAPVTAMLDRRNRLVGALVAGLSAQVYLRLPSFGFFGLQSLIAGVAFLMVLGLGYQYSTRRTRRRVRWGLGIAFTVLALILFGGVASLLNARADVQRGVDSAQRGLRAARSGEPGSVVAELELAEEALTSASERLNGWASTPLRLTPIAAQHHHSISIATEQGAQVARSAAAAVTEANLDSVTLTAGSIDLQALRLMAPSLQGTAEVMRAAASEIEVANSGWLLAPVRKRLDEFQDELSEVLPETELAAEAAAVLPSMLGADAPKTYFVMFGSPAESREFGGLLGSWALLEFDDGKVRFGQSGRIRELNSLAQSNSISADSVPPWFLSMGRPTTFPQNLTSSPSFEVVARAADQVLAGITSTPVDGYIYMDSWAIVDMLNLTGPVSTELWPVELTAETAPAFFFEGQYSLDANRTEIFGALASVAEGIVTQLETRALPGPEKLGEVLGPAARAGRLQVFTGDERQDAFLRRVHLLRDFGRGESTDFLGVVQTNGTASKLDLYLEREVTYDVQVDSDGVINGVAQVSLQSFVPSEAAPVTVGPEDRAGVNHVLLSVYSPHAVTEVRIDGASVDFQTIFELGLARTLVVVPVEPTGESVRVEFAISGVVDSAAPYELEVWHQPLVNTDQVSVQYTGPEDSFRWVGFLVENTVISGTSVE